MNLKQELIKKLMDTASHSTPWQHGVSLLRLMQIVSPALPVGAYSHSHGLEYAVSAGWVTDEITGQEWILGLLKDSVGQIDIPVLARLYRAWQAQDFAKVCFWDEFLFACRDSGEIQAADIHLGAALARLLLELGIDDARPWCENKGACFATVFALAAMEWQIPLRDTAMGYLWSWSENQVMAALKLIPLGQTAGQRILSQAVALIPEIVDKSLSIEDDRIGGLMPGMAIGSALHEKQYSRLFRS